MSAAQQLRRASRARRLPRLESDADADADVVALPMRAPAPPDSALNLPMPRFASAVRLLRETPRIARCRCEEPAVGPCRGRRATSGAAICTGCLGLAVRP